MITSNTLVNIGCWGIHLTLAPSSLLLGGTLACLAAKKTAAYFNQFDLERKLKAAIKNITYSVALLPHPGSKVLSTGAVIAACGLAVDIFSNLIWGIDPKIDPLILCFSAGLHFGVIEVFYVSCCSARRENLQNMEARTISYAPRVAP